MPSDEYLSRLEARIEQLEKAGEHYTDPENQRLDRLLRKFARSIEMTAWLGGMCLKIAPIIAAVWYFGEEAFTWVRSFFEGR